VKEKKGKRKQEKIGKIEKEGRRTGREEAKVSRVK
jgi:hypothetical protein